MSGGGGKAASAAPGAPASGSKVLYPERFQDIDPAAKADQIYEFVVGNPMFARMNALFANQAFVRLAVP